MHELRYSGSFKVDVLAQSTKDLDILIMMIQICRSKTNSILALHNTYKSCRGFTSVALLQN